MAKKLRNPLHYPEKAALDLTEYVIIETPAKTTAPVADAVINKFPVTSLGGGGGSGTVTSVSVVTANGVSGSVATATTTPAITITLGAITPTSVNGTTSTEIGYVSGVTSAIQTQLNAKAPLASPTFTGTVTLPTVVLGATTLTVTGTELNYSSGVTSAIQTQLNAKAPLASPTFTGTVTLPTVVLGATTLTVTGTELNYVGGVTSAIQTQLNAKASIAYVDSLVLGLLDYRGGYDASSNTYPTTGGSGTAGAVVKGDMWVISVPGTLGGEARQVGDAIISNVDTPGQTASNWDALQANISYVPEDVANKVTSISGASTDTQYPTAKLLFDQLALKAPLASPTFTGTVTLPTVVLGATTLTVTGTELNYVSGVTSAIQTQLNAKAPLASPTFTGTVTLPTVVLGATTLTVTGTELNYVSGVTSAIQTQLNAKAPLASPALTGVPTAPTAVNGTNTTQIATTAFVLANAGGALSDSDYGDITVSGTGTIMTIDNDVVTNDKLANVATATFKGRTTAGTGDPEDLTATEATALLNTFTSGLKGLVPASGGGTTNFLRADGSFAAPTAVLADGDYGDVDVSSSGTVLTVQSATGNFNIDGDSFTHAGTGGNSTNFSAGSGAFAANSTGVSDVAIGEGALAVSTSATSCVAVGAGALGSANGNNNTAIGQGSLNALTSGAGNTAVGSGSATSAQCNSSTIMGANSFPNLVNGDYNTAIGASVGSNLTSGDSNTFLGFNTGLGIETGSGNTIVGAGVSGLSDTLANNIILANGTGAIKAQHDGTDWTLTGAVTVTGSVYASTGIEVGHATDTTITRVSAGRIAVEGVNVVTTSSTDTLTNKRVTQRVSDEASNATPSVNSDNFDAHEITALAADITSFTISGTPTRGQPFRLSITDDGSPKTINLGSSFVNGAAVIPAGTVASTRLDMLFIFDVEASKWRCMAAG